MHNYHLTGPEFHPPEGLRRSIVLAVQFIIGSGDRLKKEVGRPVTAKWSNNVLAGRVSGQAVRRWNPWPGAPLGRTGGARVTCRLMPALAGCSLRRAKPGRAPWTLHLKHAGSYKHSPVVRSGGQSPYSLSEHRTPLVLPCWISTRTDVTLDGFPIACATVYVLGDLNGEPLKVMLSAKY